VYRAKEMLDSFIQEQQQQQQKGDNNQPWSL
jgi:hypothetical protein